MFFTENTTQNELETAAVARGIPPHMIETIAAYIMTGRPPGGFLSALLANNLFEAMARADALNKGSFMAYYTFLYDDAPCHCFGSESAVINWIKNGGLQGTLTK